MYHGLSEKKAKHNSGSVKQWVWEAVPYRVLYFVKHRNRLPPNAIFNSTNEFFQESANQSCTRGVVGTTL